MNIKEEYLSLEFVIYKITNTLNGKSYIGLTSKPLRKRLDSHKYNIKSGVKGYFYSAVRKYGIENFTCEILENVKDRDLNHLRAREVYWISFYNTYKDGYNSTIGGDGVIGYAWTEEQKKRASISKIGRKLSLESRKKLSDKRKGELNPMYGKDFSEEHRRKLSGAKIGRKSNNDTTGKKLSAETREKLSKSRTGSKNHKSRAVVKLSLDGIFIEEFGSANEGAKSIGSNSNSKVTLCCQGKRGHHKGFKWMYKEEYEKLIAS